MRIVRFQDDIPASVLKGLYQGLVIRRGRKRRTEYSKEIWREGAVLRGLPHLQGNHLIGQLFEIEVSVGVGIHTEIEMVGTTWPLRFLQDQTGRDTDQWEL